MIKTALLLGAIALAFAVQVRGQEPKKPSFQFPLNHFYVVLDPASYKAIEGSDFLRGQLAPSETRTTVRTDMTYTGLYFYGMRTYFELFDGSSPAMGGVGASGLAFGVEETGALEALAKERPDRFLAPELITRGFKDAQLPWFYMGVPKTLSPGGLRVWIMEYHPRFLAEWNPMEGKTGITRSAVLERYAAVLKPTPPQPYLQDVTGLTINLDSATAAKLVEICQALGYAAKTEGGVTTLDGPEVQLRVTTDAAAPKGIREMTLRVSREPEGPKELSFGKSVLRFMGNGRATWTFQ